MLLHHKPRDAGLNRPDIVLHRSLFCLHLLKFDFVKSTLRVIAEPQFSCLVEDRRHLNGWFFTIGAVHSLSQFWKVLNFIVALAWMSWSLKFNLTDTN